MSHVLIAITGCIYAVVGVDQFIKGNSGQAIMWVSYACANYGLYLGAK
jgi:hypothetical protein